MISSILKKIYKEDGDNYLIEGSDLPMELREVLNKKNAEYKKQQEKDKPKKLPPNSNNLDPFKLNSINKRLNRIEKTLNLKEKSKLQCEICIKSINNRINKIENQLTNNKKAIKNINQFSSNDIESRISNIENVLKEKKEVSEQPSSPIPNKNIDKNNPVCPNSDRIDTLIEKNINYWDDLGRFIHKIRIQQQVAFNAIYTAINQPEYQLSQDYDGIYLDLPIREKKEYFYYRCFLDFSNNRITASLIASAYQGQPIFPRLTKQGQLFQLSDIVRKEVYSQFLALKKLKKCPLNDVPRLMLRIAYSNPNIKYSTIKRHMYDKKTIDGRNLLMETETIGTHFRKFSKITQQFFGVKFELHKEAALYWYESGFNIKPIEDKFNKK